MIPESQAVQMIIQNLRDPLRALMLLGPVRTYVELYERASQLERNLKKGMLGYMFSTNAANSPPLPSVSSYKKKNGQAWVQPNQHCFPARPR